MTRYKWVKENFPDRASLMFRGGVAGCPGTEYYSGMPGYVRTATSDFGCDFDCEHCWNQEIPSDDPASVVDNVNHPAHYELPGGIECFDVLLATQGVEAVKGFCICNAVKYLFRRNRKNGDEDVKKAAWYVAKYIELAKKEADANG